MTLSAAQVLSLTIDFARLNADGLWEIPMWVHHMRQAVELPDMPAFYVIQWAAV